MGSELQPLLFWIPFAAFVELVCGGAFRYADVPSRRTVAWVYRRTWWLGIGILLACGFYAAVALGASAPGLLSLFATIAAAALGWRWRSAEDTGFRVPGPVAKTRLIMGKVGMTDALRWRRALVMVGQSAVLVAALLVSG